MSHYKTFVLPAEYKYFCRLVCARTEFDLRHKILSVIMTSLSYWPSR